MTNYPQGYGAPRPPKQGMSTGAKLALGCGIPTVLGLLLFGGCAVLAGTAVNEVDKAVKADASEDARAAREDVQLTSCRIDDGLIRDVKASVKITNNGDKRATYSVKGEFLDTDGNKVGELLAYVENLAPGTSSTQPFSGFFTSVQLDGVTSGTCKILEVSRDEWLAVN